MSDEYREVETVGWESKIGNSLIGVGLGIILFFASFVVLYWNEGRVNLSQVARTSVEISATSSNSSAIGQLVSTTGLLTTDELLGDNLFLKPGAYIALKREVEMYAWDEEKTTETKKSLLDNSETKITTYKYKKKWTLSPENSNSFKYSQTHHNPPKAFPDATNRVSLAKVGIYGLDISTIELPISEEVALNNQNIIFTNNINLTGNYLYKGTGTIQNPQVGDIRIQYFSLPNKSNVTVLGQLATHNQIVPYIHKSNERLYRAFAGSRKEAISTLNTEYTILTWILRFMGFLMMWIGLFISLEPISTLLDFLPLIGSIGRGFASASSFLIAFVLSTATILISMLLHNLVALVLAVTVAVGVIVFCRKIRN